MKHASIIVALAALALAACGADKPVEKAAAPAVSRAPLEPVQIARAPAYPAPNVQEPEYRADQEPLDTSEQERH
jgi:hypothetical protein